MATCRKRDRKLSSGSDFQSINQSITECLSSKAIAYFKLKQIVLYIVKRDARSDNEITIRLSEKPGFRQLAENQRLNAPKRGAYDAPPDFLVGWGGDIPFPSMSSASRSLHLRRFPNSIETTCCQQ